jgi:high-affinity iron transporter
MLAALTMTLREGLGAFLVVGVLLAILRRAREYPLLTATRWGIGLSLVTTAAASALFSLAGNQALWEGLLALAAAALVAWLGRHLWRTTRSSNYPRRSRLEWVATIGITLLMITRGSMEIGLVVGTLLWQVPAWEVIAGAVSGTAAAITLAWLWARFGRRLPRPHFRQVTAVFLLVLWIHLIVDGVHEIMEANVIAGSEPFYRATVAFSSDGVYGYYAPYLLLVVPLAWWLLALFWGHGKASDGRVAHVGR